MFLEMVKESAQKSATMLTRNIDGAMFLFVAASSAAVLVIYTAACAVIVAAASHAG